MGKMKGLVIDMGYERAKRYVDELKIKIERDKRRGGNDAVPNETKERRYEATIQENQ